jgi:hypothetical protein
MPEGVEPLNGQGISDHAAVDYRTVGPTGVASPAENGYLPVM